MNATTSVGARVVGGMGPEGPLPNRAAVLNHAGAERWWALVPAATRLVLAKPDDHELRGLLVRGLVALGLRTAALEQVALLPEGSPGRAELGASAEGLGADELTAAMRLANATRNAEILAKRAEWGVDLRPLLERWAMTLGEAQWFTTLSGSVVRRVGGGTGRWVRFVDDRGAAESAPVACADAAWTRPIYLDSIDPPWLLRRLVRSTPRRLDQAQPLICVAQRDEAALLDGLSVCDLSGELAEARVRVWAGPLAVARMVENMAAGSDWQIEGAVVATDAGAGLAEAVNSLVAAQAKRAEALGAKVNAAYAGRDAAHWGKRFRECEQGGLRVLLPTTRYSTFLQHSAADLAAALGRAGHTTRVHIEPDHHSTHTSVGTLRAIDELRPDVVILINYTRAHLGGFLPAGLPVVCWVQDEMPHLFSRAAGGAQGPLDFVMGHLYDTLFDHFGYPKKRALHSPVVASGEKFHAGPVDAELLRKHTAEVAYCSHQSETPEQFVEGMLKRFAAAGANNAMVRVAREVVEPVRRVVDSCDREWMCTRLVSAAREALRAATGREPDAAATAQVVSTVCRPLADKMLRHQTLAWAAEICTARRWRMALYGRGWEKHPTLSRFARGELGHGEELRAAYQGAAAHLHASTGGWQHQRVMECALSGGLPLVRRKRDDLATIEAYTSLAVLRSAQGPDFCEVSEVAADHKRLWATAADHAEALMLYAQWQRLGRRYSPIFDDAVHVEALDGNDPRTGARSLTGERDAAWLMGDLAETTFAEREELERLLEKAVERKEWRADLSAGIACRVRRMFTTDALVGRMLGMMRDELG